MRALCFALLALSLIAFGGCSRASRDIPFQTQFIPYEGDLESIKAAPRIVAIRSKDSPLISVIAGLTKIDLKPLTQRGLLLVFSESRTVTRVQERQDESEIWIFTEDRCKQIPGFDAPRARSVLGVAIIPHSAKTLQLVDKSPVYSE